MNDKVLYELDGHVATITYNRPEALNAIDAAVRADLNAAFARFRDEEDVLGTADGQLIRERVGDLQAGDRGGQRPLPGLRPDEASGSTPTGRSRSASRAGWSRRTS